MVNRQANISYQTSDSSLKRKKYFAGRLLRFVRNDGCFCSSASTRILINKTRTWNLNFGICYLGFDIWNLLFGTWNFRLTLFLILLSPFTFAQMLPDTVSIPEVEIHSAKKLKTAGLQVEKIDSLVMMREADVSLSDLLNSHSAVFVKSEGRGALAIATFRGTDASHTAVFWNGISLASPMLGQVDFSQIPVYLMDDISLHPGASSLVDGSGSLGGSILLQTKLKWKKQLAVKAMSAYGSYRTFNHYLKISTGTAHLQLSTQVYTNKSKNDFSFYNKNIADIDPITGKYIYPWQKNEEAAYQLSGLVQSVAYRFQKHYLLQLHYWFQHSTRALPRLNTYEGDDHTNLSRQNSQTHRAVLHLSRFGKNSRIEWQSGLVDENMDYRVKNLILGKDYYNAVHAVSKTLSSFNKLSYEYRPGKNTILKAAYDFNFHHVNTLDSVTQNGYDRFRRNHRLFASWQQQISRQFSTSVILRKEWVNQFSIPLIPYLGFDWTLDGKKQWMLHANVARNYHYPDLNDLYWQPGGNPELKPEEGMASELGIKINPHWKKTEFKVDITGFYQDIQHWILWMPSPMGYWTPQNIRHVISKGIEINTQIHFQIKDFSVNMKAGYAFTRSQNYGSSDKWGADAIGRQIPYVPVHSGNFTANFQWKLFHLTWVNSDYSERFTTSTNQSNLRDWLYPYFMNQLYFGKEFMLKHGSLQLQLKIYNLFNEDYRSVLGRPMPGRNYLLVLTFAL